MGDKAALLCICLYFFCALRSEVISVLQFRFDYLEADIQVVTAALNLDLYNYFFKLLIKY